MNSIQEIKDLRSKIQKFVKTYHQLPVLWDVKCQDYTKKDRRNKAYEILLKVYQSIKPNSTVEDVKKKINSMRSNFRKELRKVTESANAGIFYKPSSWMYDELIFLKDLESPMSWRQGSISEDDMVSNSHEEIINDKEVFPIYSEPSYPNKRRRYSEVNHVDVPPPARNAIDSLSGSEEDIAKVWAAKLKSLDSMQKLFAEKAINDVLFEAQLGTLQRNSVKINECHAETHQPASKTNSKRLEPTQSSPEYKYSETDAFLADDDNN